MLLPYFVEQYHIVIDTEGKGISQISLKMIMEVIQAMSVKFVGRAFKVYLANTPFIFQATWVLIKRLLDEDTAKKVCFVKYGKNKELFEDFEEDQLLESFGGRLKAPDRAWPVVNTLSSSARPKLNEDPEAESTFKEHHLFHEKVELDEKNDNFSTEKKTNEESEDGFFDPEETFADFDDNLSIFTNNEPVLVEKIEKCVVELPNGKIVTSIRHSSSKAKFHYESFSLKRVNHFLGKIDFQRKNLTGKH